MIGCDLCSPEEIPPEWNDSTLCHNQDCLQVGCIYPNEVNLKLNESPERYMYYQERWQPVTIPLDDNELVICRNCYFAVINWLDKPDDLRYIPNSYQVIRIAEVLWLQSPPNLSLYITCSILLNNIRAYLTIAGLTMVKEMMISRISWFFTVVNFQKLPLAKLRLLAQLFGIPYQKIRKQSLIKSIEEQLSKPSFLRGS